MNSDVPDTEVMTEGSGAVSRQLLRQGGLHFRDVGHDADGGREGLGAAGDSRRKAVCRASSRGAGGGARGAQNCPWES